MIGCAIVLLSNHASELRIIACVNIIIFCLFFINKIIYYMHIST